MSTTAAATLTTTTRTAARAGAPLLLRLLRPAARLHLPLVPPHTHACRAAPSRSLSTQTQPQTQQPRTPPAPAQHPRVATVVPTKPAVPGTLGSVGPDGQVIFVGPMNTWLRNFKVAAVVLCIGSSFMLPPIYAEASASPASLGLAVGGAVATIGSLLAITFAVSHRYVTLITRPLPKYVAAPLSASGGGGGGGSGSALRQLPSTTLTIETRSLWESRKRETVRIADLRYKPFWLWQTWVTHSEPRKRWFIEGGAFMDDPLFVQVWGTVQRQTPGAVIINPPLSSSASALPVSL
ncbi:hypothetical protein BC831DRAFT_511573 [Entophlyctis helioformis]|nr:hypothetical protein BC831DRAFT_511573 [Entophlyctis helioformis]